MHLPMCIISTNLLVIIDNVNEITVIFSDCLYLLESVTDAPL